MASDELFWRVADQDGRLAEVMGSDPKLCEVPLRRDVRSLGRLLGTVIREQEGDKALAGEEELRLLAISHRSLEILRVPKKREPLSPGSAPEFKTKIRPAAVSFAPER